MASGIDTIVVMSLMRRWAIHAGKSSVNNQLREVNGWLSTTELRHGTR
jgi:hypothetical protein